MAHDFKGETALVIGGGFGGLLAGHALAKSFAKVIIIEMDPLPVNALSRGGVPQGPHAHLLIPKCAATIDKLLPGFCETLVNNGAHRVDLFKESRFYDYHGWKPTFTSQRFIYLQSRALIEATIRQLVQKKENIFFIYNTEVEGLLLDPFDKSIKGVRIRDLITSQRSEIEGSVVVDASGSRSPCAFWLESYGFPVPEKTEVPIHYCQVSRLYRWHPEHVPDWKYMVYRHPSLKKGAYLMNIENNTDGEQWLVGLVGYFGHRPVFSETGFLDFARELGPPECYEAIKNATSVTPLKSFSLSHARRYHFRHIPAGLFVVGDGLCVWPPHSGLGMTFCAIAAELLSDLFENSRSRQIQFMTKRYYKSMESIISKHWKASVKDDVLPFNSDKKPSLLSGFKIWYRAAILEACNTRPKLWEKSIKIGLSEKTSVSLLSPEVIFQVILNKMGI